MEEAAKTFPQEPGPNKNALLNPPFLETNFRLGRDRSKHSMSIISMFKIGKVGIFIRKKRKVMYQTSFIY